MTCSWTMLQTGVCMCAASDAWVGEMVDSQMIATLYRRASFRSDDGISDFEIRVSDTRGGLSGSLVSLHAYPTYQSQVCR